MAYAVRGLFPLRVERGQSVHDAIERAVLDRGLRGGLIIAIGGLRYAEVGVFDRRRGAYEVAKLEASEDETIEAAPIAGNYLVTSGGRVSIHLHACLSSKRARASGHLLAGVADPFLEVFLLEVGDVVREAFFHRDE